MTEPTLQRTAHLGDPTWEYVLGPWIQLVDESHTYLHSDVILPLITKCYKVPGVVGILARKRTRVGLYVYKDVQWR